MFCLFFPPTWVVHCDSGKPAPGPGKALGVGEIQDHLLWTPSLVWCQVCFWAQQQTPASGPLRPLSPQAAGGQCRSRTGVPPVIRGCLHTWPSPPSAASLCLSVLFRQSSQSSLTLFVTLSQQAPLWDFPSKNTGVACYFLLHVLPF